MELDEHARPLFARALEFDLARLGTSYGPFSSRSAARQFLMHLAADHALCLKTLGLEGRRSAADDGAPCFNRQLNRCQGACVGDEPRADHAARLREALEPLRLPSWPYRGAVALVERNAGRFREDWHVFDRWCWLGTVKTIDAARGLAMTSPRAFEADAARLAIRSLLAEAPWPLERVDLGSP
jgi:DNA polymerase-3 subunit epsilon